MFITTHAAIGALIGEAFGADPVVAVSLAFASHFVSDVIPHGDTKIYKGFVSGSRVKRAVAYVMLDTVVAMGFILLLLNSHTFEHRRVVSLAIFVSVLPDVLVAIVELFRPTWLKWFRDVHHWFHFRVTGRTGDIPFLIGFTYQAVFVLLTLTRWLAT